MPRRAITFTPAFSSIEIAGFTVAVLTFPPAATPPPERESGGVTPPPTCYQLGFWPCRVGSWACPATDRANSDVVRLPIAPCDRRRFESSTVCLAAKSPAQRPERRRTRSEFAPLNGQAFIAVFIDSCQQEESLSASQLVAHYVHAPNIIGKGENSVEATVELAPRPPPRRSRDIATASLRFAGHSSTLGIATTTVAGHGSRRK